MIKYALVCEQGHDFESWFSGSESFETQASRGFVECPHCGSTQVRKALMAPAVSTSKRRTRNEAAGHSESQPPAPDAAPEAATGEVALIDERQRALREAIRELHAKVREQTVDVGAQFSEEARRMHLGEAPTRPIRGEATVAQAKELWEEGVPVFPIPALPDDRN